MSTSNSKQQVVDLDQEQPLSRKGQLDLHFKTMMSILYMDIYAFVKKRDKGDESMTEEQVSELYAKMIEHFSGLKNNVGSAGHKRWTEMGAALGMVAKMEKLTVEEVKAWQEQRTKKISGAQDNRNREKEEAKVIEKKAVAEADIRSPRSTVVTKGQHASPMRESERYQKDLQGFLNEPQTNVEKQKFPQIKQDMSDYFQATPLPQEGNIPFFDVQQMQYFPPQPQFISQSPVYTPNVVEQVPLNQLQPSDQDALQNCLYAFLQDQLNQQPKTEQSDQSQSESKGKKRRKLNKNSEQQQIAQIPAQFGQISSLKARYMYKGIIISDILFRQTSFPITQFLQIQKGQTKVCLNQSIKKGDLIGKLSHHTFQKSYFEEIMSEFTTPEQMIFSKKVLLSYLTTNWKQHEKINVVGIIEQSFNQYGCITYQPDKNYLKRLKAQMLATVIKQDYGIENFQFFQYLEQSEDIETTDDELVEALYEYQMELENKKLQREHIYSDQEYMEKVKSELGKKLENRRKNQSLLVRCVLCNEVIELARSRARCKPDCEARKENNNDINISCLDCVSRSIECIEHLNFHVNLVDYSLKNQSMLQANEALRLSQCFLCNSTLTDNPTLHAVRYHQTHHCIQALSQGGGQGLALNRFYGSVYQTNLQTLLQKSLPDKDLTLVAIYDQSITTAMNPEELLVCSLGEVRIVMGVCSEWVATNGTEGKSKVMKKIHEIAVEEYNRTKQKKLTSPA